MIWQERWMYWGALGVFWGKVLRVFEGVSRALFVFFLENWGSLTRERLSVEFFGVRDILRRARYWGSLRGEGWIGEDQSQPWLEPPPRPHTSVQSVHSSDEDVIVGKTRRQRRCVCAIFQGCCTIFCLFLHFAIKIDKKYAWIDSRHPVSLRGGQACFKWHFKLF